MREKLIRILDDSFMKQYEKRGLLTAPHTAADLVANDVTIQKWIPVSERLPEHPEYDWVLVQVKMNPEDYYGVPHIAELRNGTWYDEDDLPLEEFRCVKVTHWMPLPEPPREG